MYVINSLLLVLLSSMSSRSHALFSRFFNKSNGISSTTNKMMSTNTKYPIYCDESVMKPKAHGSSEKPVMQKLRWGCDWKVAGKYYI